MSKSLLAKIKNLLFPVIIEKDEDNFYVVECPLFKGCYSQGKTLDEALKNIKEVILLCLEEKENQEIIKNYQPITIPNHKVLGKGLLRKLLRDSELSLTEFLNLLKK